MQVDLEGGGARVQVGERKKYLDYQGNLVAALIESGNKEADPLVYMQVRLSRFE